MSKYGENIKKIRSVRGLTQSQLADMIDVSRGVISSYEEGRAEPKIETIIKTADIFQLTVDVLLKQNVTVNQLSGFSLPDIVQNAKKTDTTHPSAGILSGIFPENVVIVKGEDLKPNIYLKNNEIAFGLNAKPFIGDFFILRQKNHSVIGEIKAIKPDGILLGEQEIAIKNIVETIKVTGIYHPISSLSPLEKRLLDMEKRLAAIEKQIS